MPHKESSPPSSQTTVESAARAARIRVKNRRKMYLDRHPSYFSAPDLELVDPLLYDRCVRRFQSAAEREADGKSKGYSGVLEADLYRSEAKLAALKRSSPSPSLSSLLTPSTSISYSKREDGEVLPEDPDEVPMSKEEGLERWRWEMEARFLRGEDEEVDYGRIDDDERWDVFEEREVQERYFEEEEPEWVETKDGEGVGGETGVQDF